MRTVLIAGGGIRAACLDVSLFNQNDLEVWGVNCQRLEAVLPRWDRMFNIHKYDLLKAYGYPLWKDMDWHKDHPDTLFYTADRWPDGRMTTAHIFPRYEIAASFPTCRNDYHVNSCDWLLAYAVHKQFEEIRLHGFTLARDGASEQMSARACAEYWMGVAEGRGIKIILGKDSDLCHPYHLVRSDRVYGYDDCPAWEDRSRDRRWDDVPY